jgi:microcystin-dependent protein
LTVNQIPAHSHALLGTDSTGTSANPGGNLFAQTTGTIAPYTVEPSSVNMNANSVGPVGGSQPHNNFQPYLCVDFIISLFGIFPSQT